MVIKKLIYRIQEICIIKQFIDMSLTVGCNFNQQVETNLKTPHCWLTIIGNDVIIASNIQILTYNANQFKRLAYIKIGCDDIRNMEFISVGKKTNNLVIDKGTVATKLLNSNIVYVENSIMPRCSIDKFYKKCKTFMSETVLYDESYALRRNIDKKNKEQQKTEPKNKKGYVI